MVGIMLWLQDNEKGRKDVMMKCIKATDIPMQAGNT